MSGYYEIIMDLIESSKITEAKELYEKCKSEGLISKDEIENLDPILRNAEDPIEEAKRVYIESVKNIIEEELRKKKRCGDDRPDDLIKTEIIESIVEVLKNRIKQK
jgi:hypothetical protein